MTLDVSARADFSDNYLQYARPLSRRWTPPSIRLLLLSSVCSPAPASLCSAGLMVARRAMAPIARPHRHGARDHSRPAIRACTYPKPGADDEVAELARTFDQMLRALDAARGETEATLARQRQFVADASHELRTPLTSVLANLELLAESLHGDQGEAPLRAALNAADAPARRRPAAPRPQRRRPGRAPGAVRPRQLAGQVAAELGPWPATHTLDLDAAAPSSSARRDGSSGSRSTSSRTPRATRRRHTVTVAHGPRPPPAPRELRRAGRRPGRAAEIAPTRCSSGSCAAPATTAARSASDWRSCRAVAESHGGSVTLQSPPPPSNGAPAHGARFVVQLPTAKMEQKTPLTPSVANPAV